MGQKVRHRVTLAGKCRNELGGAIHVMWEGRVAVQRGWSYTAVHSALCRNRFSDFTQGHGMLLRGLVLDVLGRGGGGSWLCYAANQ